MNMYKILLDSDGGFIQEGPDVYIQNKDDDTILKVALTDVAPFLTGVTQPYNISTESMPNLNVPSTSYIIKNWTREAILQLINIRQKYDKQFRSTTIKTEKCWQLVVKDMEERGNVSTVNQCRDKWKYLKERYTKKKDNMSTRSSGTEFFKFDFFEEMDSFLGKNASITPVALAASMKRNMNNEDTDDGTDGSILEHDDGERTPSVKKKEKLKKTL